MCNWVLNVVWMLFVFDVFVEIDVIWFKINFLFFFIEDIVFFCGVVVGVVLIVGDLVE